MHEAACTGGHIQLVTWLSSTALEDCAGSEPQNKLRQVLHAYAVLGVCQSCLINFLPLLDSVSFIRRKAGLKDWCFLVFSESVFTRWGIAVKGQRSQGKLGGVKTKKNMNPKRIQNPFSNWSLI